MTFKQLCLYSTLLASFPSLPLGAEQGVAEQDQDLQLFRLCPADSSTAINYSPPPIFSAENIDAINVSAEEVKNTGKTVTTFSGNVVIERHLLRLQADQVLHDNEAQRLDLMGHIHADTEGMALNAETGWLNLQTNEGEFQNSIYYVPETHLTGKVPVFNISSKKTTTLIDTQFSTCPPEKPDWHLDTAWLELDKATATGTAKHTVLWLKDIPVFYLPWIQFPLGDERRSGFLMPNIGTSSSNGFEVSTPWYWNIAPNQDALITPRYMRQRGSMLLTDYRYLTHSSRGDLNVEYLSNDQELQQERYLLHFDNQSQINRHLSLNLLANNASDDDYLRDLGSNISITNTTHLERNARLNYNYGEWHASIMAQSFQTIDQDIADTDRPYRRLPQITLRGSEDLGAIGSSDLTGSLQSEWVDFEHEAENKEQGSRFHIYPKLSLPVSGSAWFIKPVAGLMHTQYDTTDTNGNNANLQDRNLGVFSLDSGLFFERELSDNSIIQTLEPRLFYLNIPYEDQSAFPVFDTSEQDFSFASLFRDNRFNGVDRIGDANQLTVALSSRLLSKKDGDELMSASIGQIHYFDDQRVSLDNIINTSDESDIVTELSGKLNRWRARATYQWNTDTDQSDKRSIQLNYAASEKSVFNIGYRFHRDPVTETDNLEQTDVSFAWPFANNYSLLSRWNYSITEERDIETLVGLEYESCCWAMRLISQRYLTDDSSSPYDTSIMLQFVLKGFGSIADKQATNTLKHAILGYQPDY